MAPAAPGPPASRHIRAAWLIPLAVAGLLWLLPTPAGLTAEAWRYLALFVFVVVGLITEPLPGPAMGLLGIGVASGLRLVGESPGEAVRWALSGFSNEVVWLVFAAMTFSLGYEVTGLGRRIALLLVRTMGRRTLGLGYAIAFADLLLAPFMPSNTARSAGTIFPIVRAIPQLYGSTPDHEPRAIGGYLFWTAFATTAVTSSMFLTAMAPNLLAMDLARTIAGVEISWTRWLVAFLPVGILLFVATPLATYLMYPPAITDGGRVVDWAADELRRMGPPSRREWSMGGLAVLALVAWIAGEAVIAPVSVALLIVVCMMVAGVVRWQDILANVQGWNVLVWFATLVALADGLRQVGFLAWVAGRSATSLAGVPIVTAAVALVALFFLLHYFFASTTAHTTSVLPAFLAAVAGMQGMPVEAVVLVLVFSLGLMGVLTPYAMGPAPVWFGAGYITTREFWTLGAATGLFYLGTLLAVGLPYALYLTR